MDHVLNGIREHYQVSLEWFIEEHTKHNYRKYSDNPFYEEVKTLIDAMNVIHVYMGMDKITLKSEIEFYVW